jgi:hypothetical protein
MHEHHEDTEPRPEPEPTEAEYRSLTRSLAQDVCTLAVAGGVTGFTFRPASSRPRAQPRRSRAR